MSKKANRFVRSLSTRNADEEEEEEEEHLETVVLSKHPSVFTEVRESGFDHLDT
jgi:hypothetical protein